MRDEESPDHIAYAATAVRCHACREIAEGARKIAGRDDSDPLAGISFRMEKINGQLH